MLRDWQTPGEATPSATGVTERLGVEWRHADWDRAAAAALGDALTPPPADSGRRLAAWVDAVDLFLDPLSRQRRALDPALARLCRLSPAGLAAGLEAVLGGVAGAHAADAFASAAAATAAPPATPVLTVLAANLPALAAQPLLPILALGRPAVVKSARAEPLFAAAFAAALVHREPAFERSLAALTWAGGEAAVEEVLIGRSGRVLAYGGETAMAALRVTAGGKLVAYGPMTSLAVVGAGAAAGGELAATAAALARDVALFDQRGCLSVAAVYAEGEDLAGELAAALGAALADLARRWPPGPATAAEAAAVRQLRDEAAMRALPRHELALDAGTVVVEPRPVFTPSPGLRTVRVHPLPSGDGWIEELARQLVPWRGRLQGVAFAGLGAQREAALRGALTPLGVSRFAAAGELQTPDARWHNGGIDPLARLAGPDEAPARGRLRCPKAPAGQQAPSVLP